jgi:hypothetical protein
LKKNDTKLTKPMDLCHDCVQEKGILDIVSGVAWQVWNKALFAYEVKTE